MAISSSNFPIVDLKDYHIYEKTVLYIQINQVIDKPKTKTAEAEENLKKAELNFMLDLRTLIQKTSVDPKLLQLKICVRNQQKDRAPKEFSPVLVKIPVCYSPGIVIPGELKRPVVDALHFGYQ